MFFLCFRLSLLCLVFFFFSFSLFFFFMSQSFSFFPFSGALIVPSTDKALLAECKITTSLAFAQMIFNIAANKPLVTEKNLYKLAFFVSFHSLRLTFLKKCRNISNKW